MIYNINRYGQWRTTHISATLCYTSSGTPVPPVQLPAPPAQPIVPPAQPSQQGPILQLNLSHFKPELTSKTDKDAEAHLLRTND